jgi:putative ABC transport system permease protein
VNASLAERRFSMLLLTVFATSALALAAIGVYGVLTYFVAQGAREFGIRLALGASPRRLLALVLRQGLTMAAVGMAFGLGGAWGLTRFMRALLFGIDASDPATFAAVGLTLTLVALLAVYVPARRAARVDPLLLLRS